MLGRLFAALSVLLLCVPMLLTPDDVPPAWRPWEPLDLAAAPNPVGRWKLRRMTPETCRVALAAVAEAEAIADREHTDVCHIRGGVRLSRLSEAVLSPLVTRCEIAARLYWWERHSLQSAAERLLGTRVTRIRHFHSYSCRRIRTSAGLGARMSQHATANAVDIAGFDLADGRRLTLARDWPGGGAEAAFLRAAQRGLCGVFNTVLGPEFNTLHADHFHADMGPWQSCR